MRCVGGERTTPMDVDTREGELRPPLASLLFSSHRPPLSFRTSFDISTSPPLMRCVGDGREGTTPMDVDTPQGELRPLTPFAPDAQR